MCYADTENIVTVSISHLALIIRQSQHVFSHLGQIMGRKYWRRGYEIKKI
jgi:hypothetical protein